MNIVLNVNGWHLLNLTKQEWQLIVAAVYFAEDQNGEDSYDKYAALAAEIRKQIKGAEDDTEAKNQIGLG